MKQPINRAKLNWQCRRGMLELDVILIPFLDQHFDQLADEQQAWFVEFLDEADPDLYTWLMGYGQSEDSRFQRMAKIIRDKLALQ